MAKENFREVMNTVPAIKLRAQEASFTSRTWLGETLPIGREIKRMLKFDTPSTKRGGLGVLEQTKKMNTLNETT